jgi:hypothetical protein
VDSGNFSDNRTPKGEARTRGLVEGMGRLGYQVVNVGERDIRAGYSPFARRVKGSKIRFISANIVDKGTQEPIFPPHAVVDAMSPDGRHRVRVGLIGVARFNPIFSQPGPDGTTMAIAHPLDAVRASVEALRREKVEIVILLAALHRDDARRLVGAVPGIDFVIGSYGGIFTAVADREGETWIVYSGNQGKRIGATRVYRGPDGRITDQGTRLHFLTRVYPDDPEMLTFMEAARRAGEQAAAGRAAMRKVATKHGPSPFVGSAKCKDCHAPSYEHWTATAHASAHETLVREGKSGDAACQGCHATGAGLAGGFVSRETTPELASVSCESCHGAGRDHVLDPKLRYGRTTLATCTGCHDDENSPGFDYYSYLTRIAHRERATP